LIGFNSSNKFKSHHDATQSIVTFYSNIFLKFLDCCAFDKEVKVDTRFYLYGWLVLHMNNQSICGPIGTTCWRTTICNRYNDNYPFSCYMIYPLFYNNWPPH
jgi:hypothetical protein